MTATPAFPVCGDNYQIHAEGMTLRQYAAIKLRVPDSGTDWLDDMIRKSQRNELAARAMNSLLSDQKWNWDEIPNDAHEMADAMIAAQEKQS